MRKQRPTVLALRKVAGEINRDLRDKNRKKRIRPIELATVVQKYAGRCAYCGVPCVPDGSRRSLRLYFHWYIPLERGGETKIDNLVPVCSEHLHKYRPTRRLRETIPDVNTFSDLVYSLIKTTITTERLKSDNNVEAFKWEEKTNRIKRSLNALLEDIVINMQYHPFTDWKVEDTIVHEEDINTIPDMIEDAIKEELAGEPVDIEPLTESTKQILATKQYKIIRKDYE